MRDGCLLHDQDDSTALTEEDTDSEEDSTRLGAGAACASSHPPFAPELRGPHWSKSLKKDWRVLLGQLLLGAHQEVFEEEEEELEDQEELEGETIAWHLKEVLGLKEPKRVVYTEITASVVRSAIANSRKLDFNLVGAGLCRDCLDKLVGYKGSPLIWA